MAIGRLYILPVILFVSLPVLFIITYSIAVMNDHVSAEFPYISDTGTISPESCIFGQFLNIAAFIMALCVYVKYLQVKSYPKLVPSSEGVSPWVNKVSLVLGLLSCIGLDIVANFQESELLKMHLTGAFMCFGTGTLYFFTQVWISHKMPIFASRRLLVIRATLVGICCVTTVSTIAAGFSAFAKYDGPTDSKRHWGPQHGGWELHLISTISEWILCVSYCLLILSFAPEFYDLELVPPSIQLSRKKNFEKACVEP